MIHDRRSFGRGMFAGVAGTLIVLTAVGLTIIYTGTYNVAATSGHAPIARWLFDTTMHNSVRSHVGELKAPAFSAADLRAGAHEFAEYCAHCHGAPGVKPAEWASGMLPNPPSLSRAARTWSTEETFWIVKNGIKMTGMPPFGPGHDDRTVWNIAAFVNRLPAMSPEEYRALTDGGGEHGHQH